MTEQHRAYHDQWTYLRRRAELGHSDPSCILELLSRVEALEAAAKPVESNDPAPSRSLRERVADAIYSNPTSGVSEEARAAIREVATWLDQQKLQIAAEWLRREIE